MPAAARSELLVPAGCLRDGRKQPLGGHGAYALLRFVMLADLCNDLQPVPAGSVRWCY